MDVIQRKYKDIDVIRCRGMWLYFIEEAIGVINDCKEQGIMVYGLDAFKLSGRGIQSNANNSLRMEKSADNYEKAINFLSEPERIDYLYEILYEGYERLV